VGRFDRRARYDGAGAVVDDACDGREGRLRSEGKDGQAGQNKDYD
jgi:hypothetical protein